MTNENNDNMNAAQVIESLMHGAEAEGRIEALRNVSDLIHGHMSSEQFNNVLEVISSAQASTESDSFPARRKAFNASYLKTVQDMIKLPSASGEVY